MQAKTITRLAITHCCHATLVCVQVPLVMVVAFLVGRHALCIAGNLTINELLNRHRYDHLKRDDDTFYNRLDRGPLTNCIRFWPSKPVAWDEMYHQERLVSLFLFLQEYCTAVPRLLGAC